MITVTDEAMTRAMMNKVLVKNLRPKSHQQMTALENTTEEILANIKSSNSFSADKQYEAIQDGALNQAYWFHAQLSGLVATWEFKIRLFGEMVGAKSSVPIKHKSKRNRAKKSIEHRKLSDVISDINRVSGNRLTLRLPELSALRDAIVHCNPQSMKPYAQAVIGKDALARHRGNVFIADFSGAPPINLSDLKEEHEVENQPLFGWFLEVFNSGLPKKAFDVFGESISAIDHLAHFKAISFDGREQTFKNVFTLGKIPTGEEIQNYERYFSQNGAPEDKTAEDYFKRLSKHLKLSN
ncbi:hypothetical protein [Bdellovibrio sp. HCB-162]|uniref:hypothetical protein n=1 Tax=Bdellovibrio sp. HCB-162 TaxID=3394234 RepID=UPI0039BD283C